MKRLLLLILMIVCSVGAYSQKIEDLPRALIPAATDLVIIDQADATRAITVAALMMGPPAPWVGLIPDGTAAAPGMAFWADLDVGIYRPGADIIAFTAGAVEGFRIAETAGAILSTFVNDVWVQDTLFFAYDSTYIVDAADSLYFFVDDTEVMRLQDVAGVGQALFDNGTEALPSISFIGDPDLGFYNTGGNILYLTTGGSLKWRFQSAWMGSAGGAGGRLDQDGTSATSPFVYGRGDVNSGVGSPGEDSLSLIAGGVEGIRIAEGGGKIWTTLIDTTIIEEALIPDADEGADIGISAKRFNLGYFDTVFAAVYTNSDFVLSESGSDITINADSVKGPTVLFGIDHDDLLDKSATETVAGTWEFGRLHALNTTEQLRLSYDATNYLTTTLLDDGHTTFVTVDLDGDEADINFDPDGNVGVKTAAPSTALEVTGVTTSSGGFTDGVFTVDGSGVFTAVASITSTGAITVGGVLSGLLGITLDTDATVVLTAPDCRNKMNVNDDADVIDYTLPACAAGLVWIAYDAGGGVITVDPFDGTDTIYLNGNSVGAGDEVDSPGAVGDFLVFIGFDDTRWYTGGRSGVWVDANP